MRGHSEASIWLEASEGRKHPFHRLYQPSWESELQDGLRSRLSEPNYRYCPSARIHNGRTGLSCLRLSCRKPHSPNAHMDFQGSGLPRTVKGEQA